MVKENGRLQRCYAQLSRHMTASDEAFMLLVLENNYNMWLDAESNKVGRGKYIEHAANKKFYSWNKEGMHWFNKLQKLVQENRLRPFAKDIEEETYKTLAKRYQSMFGVNP